MRELGDAQRVETTGIGVVLTQFAAGHELVFNVGAARAVEYISSRPDSNAGRGEVHDWRLRTIWAAPSSKLTYSALAALARRGGEESGQRGFGRAGRARDQDVAAAVVAPVQHVVQARQPRRDPFVGDVYASRSDHDW